MRTFNIISAYLSKIPYRLKCSFMKFYNLGLIFRKKRKKKPSPNLSGQSTIVREYLTILPPF